jgi:hypothetical protein
MTELERILEGKLEIRKPDPFDGSNRQLWRTFLSDCLRMFAAKPIMYESEKSQIIFTASYLTGSAARFYQNLVEKEMMDEEHRQIPALHNWTEFRRLFGEMFGVHDEMLHAQAMLDKTYQQSSESFADYIVRFEDAALLTQYNDSAKRWKLIRQIVPSLRERLTLGGRLPATYKGVRSRLLDLDGARAAFAEAGLTTSNVTYNYA